MKSAFVFVKPAGRQTRSGGTAWYDCSFRSLIDNYFNIGDMTVYDSTRRVLDIKQEVSIDIDQPVDKKQAERISAHFECLVLRASNYIHDNMEWGHFEDWLEAIQLPVLCLGVGAQAAERRRITLSPSSERIWRIISERSPSIGVRGEFTASVLEDHGISNSEIVGCPSIFRHLKSTLSLRHKPFSEIKRVGFSLRRETDHTYSSNVGEFLETQKRLLLRTHKAFDLLLLAHGEIEEKVYYFNDISRLASVRAEFARSGWFDEENFSVLESIYALRLFFSTVVSHYDEIVEGLDFTFGYRVHGVLPALAAGTPSFLLRYDTRSAELAETLKVPLLDPQQAAVADFEELFHQDRFSEFTANYTSAYETMRRFLDKQEIAHKMR